MEGLFVILFAGAAVIPDIPEVGDRVEIVIFRSHLVIFQGKIKAALLIVHTAELHHVIRLLCLGDQKVQSLCKQETVFL